VFFGCTGLMAIDVEASNGSYSSVNGVLFNKDQSVLLQYPAGKAGSYLIPDSVTSIEYHAFAFCTGLTSVTIPDSVTNIGGILFAPFGENVFFDCTGLMAIDVDASNGSYSSVDGVLFNKGQSVLFVYPGGKAGSYLIPDSVTSIGNHAFRNCTSLTSVTIGNSVTSIGYSAFSQCTGLTSVTIGNGVTFIGDGAFSLCRSLTSVSLPNSVTSIGVRAFSYCTGLMSISVPESNGSFSSVDGVLFDKGQSLLLQYPGGKAGSHVIPDSVAFIGENAFTLCRGLTSVTIPESVTSIGNGAFSQCTGLARVYFSGNAPRLGLGGASSLGVFQGSINSTIHYLPDTAGWGSTYAGRPTTPWLPEVQTEEASFGEQEGSFGFPVFWAAGKEVVVEAATTLINPVWKPVSTNAVRSSYLADFNDPGTTAHTVRFYRVRP